MMQMQDFMQNSTLVVQFETKWILLEKLAGFVHFLVFQVDQGFLHNCFVST